MSYNTASIEKIIPLFQSTAKPVLLLGAGSSVKSGVPLADEMVEKVAFWTYCKEKNINVGDFTISSEMVRSDWYKWLEQQPWFDKNKNKFEIYPDAIESLKPPQTRKDFFQWIISGMRQPSLGFQYLSNLVKQKAIRTVLTTNFDNTIEIAFTENKVTCDRVDNKEAIKFIDPTSDNAQVIYLHGSVSLYSDKNIKNEVEKLDSKLLTKVDPIISNNPLIVIGYRGAENSIMKSLLKCQKAKQNDFRKGIFWCVREPFDENNLTDQVKKLASNIQNSLIFIPIKDFDSFMEDLWNGYAKSPNNSITNLSSDPQRVLKNDFKLISSSTIDELNLVLLEQKLSAYARKMTISTPDTINRDWVISQGIKNNLLIRVKDKDIPTFAGYLLFASSIRKRINTSKVIIRIKKEERWLKKVFPGESLSEIQSENVFEGNLWEILDNILDYLKNFNREYLLKNAESSQVVSPYKSVVLRELVVNAIVHRNYEIDSPIQINISREFIEIINPGGIVDEVKNEIHDESLENWIKSGKRGAKGYRNPVIADLFYGSDKMDKEGSGLSDAWKITTENNAEITFGQDIENKNFFVKVFSRNDVLDEVTNTALSKEVVTTTYISNILQLTKIPEFVHTAVTSIRWYSDVFKNISTNWCPPFILNSGLIISFFEFNDRNPLSEIIDKGTMEKFSFNDFASNGNYNRLLVWLLNASLSSHIRSKGLYIDKKNRRSYFAKNPDDTDVSVRYFSMFKQATRLVTKKRVSPVTNEIKYWEHKCFKFQFEMINEDWFVYLNPGYVFTTDGRKDFIQQEKNTRLAAKKASRDYNLIYLRDLYFWKWILSGGANTVVNFKTVRELSNEEEDALDPNAKIGLSNAFLNHQYTENIYEAEKKVTISDLLQIEDELDDDEEIVIEN